MTAREFFELKRVVRKAIDPYDGGGGIEEAAIGAMDAWRMTTKAAEAVRGQEVMSEQAGHFHTVIGTDKFVSALASMEEWTKEVFGDGLATMREKAAYQAGWQARAGLSSQEREIMQITLALRDETVNINIVAENPADLVILQLIEWDKPTWVLDKATESLTAKVVISKRSQEGE